jgi:hypothetical protein
MLVYSLDHPDTPPKMMPARFRRDIAYFMTPSGERGAPALAAGEYWIDAEDARQWLDAGVLKIISPLDSENQAEIELTEDQEGWLDWLVEHNIQHILLAPD